MPVVNTNTIKEWFRTLKKPTEDQFWTWLDSFRHKWEKVPLDDVDGLPKVLQEKADLVNGVVPDHQLPFSVKTSEALAVGKITATNSTVKVAVHESGKNKVRLNGVVYERAFENNFAYTPVVNYTKSLIVYALPEPGLFFLAEGAEALEAVEPPLPPGAFVIRKITASTTGQNIEPEPASGLKYNEEDGWRTFNLTEVLTILPYSYDLRSSYYITGSVEGATIGGIRNALIDRNASPSWDGKEFWIYNATGGDLLLDSAAVTDDDVFRFARALTLKGDQSCKVKLRRDALEIVGVMSGGELPDLSAYALNADLNTEIVNRAAADLLEKNERIAADALKVDKPTADGTWMLQKVGAAFTWVTAVMQNIANTDLSNVSARIFTQGNTFTWNTAGFFHYLKGLVDKTGIGSYTKVVVVHPTTGEMVTRDFADPQATTLAVQNASSAQKTAMRTALLGTAVPASPTISHSFPSFIQKGVSTTIDLNGLNLTLLDPASIWIENGTDKVYASNFLNISTTLIRTVWLIPENFPNGEYLIKIQNGVAVQGLSTGKLTVSNEFNIINLYPESWLNVLKTTDDAGNPYTINPTWLANNVRAQNYIRTQNPLNHENYGIVDEDGGNLFITGNIFQINKDYEIIVETNTNIRYPGTGAHESWWLGLTTADSTQIANITDVIKENPIPASQSGFWGFVDLLVGEFYKIIFYKTGNVVLVKLFNPSGSFVKQTQWTISNFYNPLALYIRDPRIKATHAIREFKFTIKEKP